MNGPLLLFLDSLIKTIFFTLKIKKDGLGVILRPSFLIASNTVRLWEDTTILTNIWINKYKCDKCVVFLLKK